LTVRGKKAIRIFRAAIRDDDGHCEKSRGQRHFCSAAPPRYGFMIPSGRA